jgi:hypothetical protein
MKLVDIFQILIFSPLLGLWVFGLSTGIAYKYGKLLKLRLLVYLRYLILPLASLLVLGLFHAWVRWYPRIYYFLPLSIMIAGSLALGVDIIARGFGKTGKWLLLTLSMGFALNYMIGGYNQWRKGIYPWQYDMYQAAYWLAGNTQSTERSGAFNSGIIRYYSGRKVVNLDGVVNPMAFRAIRSYKLGEYIKNNGIKYIVDWEYSLNQYRPFMGQPLVLERIEEKRSSYSFKNTWVCVYRVK